MVRSKSHFGLFEMYRKFCGSLVARARHSPRSRVQALALFLSCKPDHELARLELGWALLEQGDTNGAIENLEAAKKLDPNRDTTYFQLSQAYRRAGRMAEAEQALGAYKKLIENNRMKRRESLEAENP